MSGVTVHMHQGYALVIDNVTDRTLICTIEAVTEGLLFRKVDDAASFIDAVLYVDFSLFDEDGAPAKAETPAIETGPVVEGVVLDG